MEPILFNANTHTGIRRTSNQDACIARTLQSGNKVLAAVIDGVGGYAGGERAAAIAKDCIEQYMQLPSGDTGTMLREGVLFANNQIAAERKNNQRFGEMCCVLTALVADTVAQRIHYVHVGDTRLYRFRDGKLQKLTRDHSFVGIREDAGEFTEEEAMAHPHRNQILREVGSTLHRLDDENFMDYGSDALVPGDLLLLCSDGLTDMIGSQQLTEILSLRQPLADANTQLINSANKAGGHDNITVVLLQVPAATTVVESKPVADTIVTSAAIVAPLPKPESKHLQRGKSVLLSAALLVLLVAAAGWYFNAPKKRVAGIVSVPTDSVQVNSIRPALVVPNAGRSDHSAVEGPELPVTEKADTMRITTTQNFTTIKRYTDSTGRNLVLLPGKTGQPQTAVNITAPIQSGDTLLLRNLRIIGFENGISIQLPVVLMAENLSFENTPHPFRYLFKQDRKHASILFINTMKQ